jgi:hypothetical protein
MKLLSFKHFFLSSLDSECVLFIFKLDSFVLHFIYLSLCRKFFWLETDSQLVNMAFKNIFMVRLITRWLNCLNLLKNMYFLCLTFVGKVINVLIGLPLSHYGSSFTWWDHVLSYVSGAYHRNRLDLPEFRFK